MLSVISYPVFALSLILALVFSISLFPMGWFEFRPEWLGLMVFYWTFRAPAQFGILLAWCAGLLLDVATCGGRVPALFETILLILAVSMLACGILALGIAGSARWM